MKFNLTITNDDEIVLDIEKPTFKMIEEAYGSWERSQKDCIAGPDCDCEECKEETANFNPKE